MKFDKIKKLTFLILAILLSIYIIYCSVFASFSVYIFICFFVAIILLLLLYFIEKYKINLDKEEPSFLVEFIKVSSIMYFAFFAIIIALNMLMPKNAVDENSYDYVIVFGSGVSTDDGKNDIIINKRLDKALSIAEINSKTKFVLTGAKVDEDIIEEAYYMRNYMVSKGLNDDRILVDIFSNNTYENIENSLYIITEDVINRNAHENIISRPFQQNDDNFALDFINVGFLSNDFHLTRINMMANKKGIEKPKDIVVKTNHIYRLYYEVREVLSLFKAFVLSQI